MPGGRDFVFCVNTDSMEGQMRETGWVIEFDNKQQWVLEPNLEQPVLFSRKADAEAMIRHNAALSHTPEYCAYWEKAVAKEHVWDDGKVDFAKAGAQIGDAFGKDYPDGSRNVRSRSRDHALLQAAAVIGASDDFDRWTKIVGATRELAIAKAVDLAVELLAEVKRRKA